MNENRVTPGYEHRQYTQSTIVKHSRLRLAQCQHPRWHALERLYDNYLGCKVSCWTAVARNGNIGKVSFLGENDWGSGVGVKGGGTQLSNTAYLRRQESATVCAYWTGFETLHAPGEQKMLGKQTSCCSTGSRLANAMSTRRTSTCSGSYHTIMYQTP
jgi:hypothetical protein